MTRLTVVIGDPVHHSLSPTIVNAAFEELDLDWKMLTLQVPEGKLEVMLELMQKLEMGGMSVTMPHKTNMAEFLDLQDSGKLDETAVALGAVNCVSLNEGTLTGHNTDGAGFLFSLKEEDVEVSGASVLIFGAGGASRAVVEACKSGGAKSIAVLPSSRSKPNNEPNYEEFDILVNATPIGMKGVEEGKMPMDTEKISSNHIVVDLIYNPLETELMKTARAKGAKVIGGLGMLVGQAAQAIELWTGMTPNHKIMTQAAKQHPILK